MVRLSFSPHSYPLLFCPYYFTTLVDIVIVTHTTPVVDCFAVSHWSDSIHRTTTLSQQPVSTSSIKSGSSSGG